jgi:hypothetical protein
LCLKNLIGRTSIAWTCGSERVKLQHEPVAKEFCLIRYLTVFFDTLMIGCVFFCEALLVTNVHFSYPFLILWIELNWIELLEVEGDMGALPGAKSDCNSASIIFGILWLVFVMKFALLQPSFHNLCCRYIKYDVNILLEHVKILSFTLKYLFPE